MADIQPTTILIQKNRCDFLKGTPDDRDGDMFDAIIATNINVSNLLQVSRNQQGEINTLKTGQSDLALKFSKVIGISVSVGVFLGVIVTVIVNV